MHTNSLMHIHINIQVESISQRKNQEIEKGRKLFWYDHFSVYHNCFLTSLVFPNSWKKICIQIKFITANYLDTFMFTKIWFYSLKYKNMWLAPNISCTVQCRNIHKHKNCLFYKHLCPGMWLGKVPVSLAIKGKIKKTSVGPDFNESLILAAHTALKRQKQKAKHCVRDLYF